MGLADPVRQFMGCAAALPRSPPTLSALGISKIRLSRSQ